MSTVKQPTTYQQQIAKLLSRGCVIEDVANCERILSEIDYYRLSAYFLPFKKSDDTYKEGTSFTKVYRIYEFDRKLRNLLFSAIEVIEIWLRSSLSYFHAHKYGPLGYLDTTHFNARHNHIKFMQMLDGEIDNNATVPFVQHHITQYQRQFPLWVACELFTFGMLSYFYSDLLTADKKQLMGRAYHDASTWLRCCTDLRNICAHYGRLYFRTFPSIPSGFYLDTDSSRKLWGATLSVKALYPSKEKWNQEFLPALKALFDEYGDTIDLKHIAFPADWATQLQK